MRLSPAFLILTLASGALMAADDLGEYHWVQVQGGITGHRSAAGSNGTALGAGVGTWLNGHWGVEGSVLDTRVDYGYGTAKELQLDGSVLFNPFAPSATVRPFLRLGVGPTRIGSPISGTGAYTTRLSGVAG